MRAARSAANYGSLRGLLPAQTQHQAANREDEVIGLVGAEKVHQGIIRQDTDTVTNAEEEVEEDLN